MNELLEYWRDYPPTHVLVAAYLLGGNTSRGGQHGVGQGTLLDLKQLVASAGGSIKREMPEHLRSR